MDNPLIADAFEQVADLLEFQGANAFRIRAYRNGGRTIRDLPEPVASIIDDPDRKLTDISGIGKDLAEKCAALVETGRLPMLDELLAQIPESVLDLLRIPGLGPKKAAVLHRELGITSLDELRDACQRGRVRELKGFAEKTELAILKGISIAAAAGERVYWADADAIADMVLAHLRSCPAVERLEPAGSYRRGKETVGDLDLLAVSTDAGAVMDQFATTPGLIDVLLRGDTKMSIRVSPGIQVDLRVVAAESFGAAMQYFTGSKDHNVVVRGLARQRGLKINEYGVFRVDGDNPDDLQYVAGAAECDVYAAVDLPVFPPELREARREFDWAAEGQLPKLIEVADLKGDLHMHSTDTDGRNRIEEMAVAARRAGLSYVAITDHSQRVRMVNGLDPERLLAQWDRIDRINEQFEGDFTVLKGIECDILEVGPLDLPDDVLARADWVLASIHYGQRQPREKITERIVGALENPFVSAIAHPTGRLINERPAYEVDMEAVLETAARCGKMMELNASPMRLDLNDVHCAAARNLGIPIVISTDAHSTRGLSMLRYGVMQARRAGLTKADVANTRPWAEMKQLLSRPS